MSDTEAEQNKEVVRSFFEELFATPPKPLNDDFLNEIVHENYIQHNPLAGQGRAGLRKFLLDVYAPSFDTEAGQQAAASPRIAVNLIADGEFVVRQEVRKDWMLVDIFRVKNGQLVEHWDALRTEPPMQQWEGF